MMTDELSKEEQIILVGTGGSFWLLEGEAYISAMLAGVGNYPTPVVCRIYEGIFELQLDMDEGMVVGELWAINPAIIERLHKFEHILVEEK